MDTSLAEEVQQKMATLTPIAFSLCRRIAALRRQDASPVSLNQRLTGIR